MHDKREPLSAEEALRAMHVFIDAYWRRTGRRSSTLAGLLGDTAMLPDGGTADPASWDDWLAAVDASRADPSLADIAISADSGDPRNPVPLERLYEAALGLDRPLEPMPDEVLSAIDSGKHVRAVRVLRKHAPALSLVGAKRIVDLIRSERP